MAAKVYITKSFTFDAAHKLSKYEGKCANLHGHTYKLDVTVSRGMGGFENPEHESKYVMVMDFNELKDIVQENVLDLLDHAYLNDIFSHTTAETMAVSIFRIIQTALKKGGFSGVEVACVKLWETPTSYAEYRGE